MTSGLTGFVRLLIDVRLTGAGTFITCQASANMDGQTDEFRAAGAAMIGLYKKRH